MPSKDFLVDLTNRVRPSKGHGHTHFSFENFQYVLYPRLSGCRERKGGGAPQQDTLCAQGQHSHHVEA